MSNTPALSGQQTPINGPAADTPNLQWPSLRLGYVGLLDNQRGVEIVIKAMPKLLAEYPDAALIIAGSGNYEQVLRKLPLQLGIEKSVHFLGWLKPEIADKCIEQCDIGLIPHHAVPGWNATIPNKLFNYMRLGKPVLVWTKPPVSSVSKASWTAPISTASAAGGACCPACFCVGAPHATAIRSRRRPKGA